MNPLALSPRAIPVRTRQYTLRELVLRVDPEFNRTSQEQPEYEFTGRTFFGRYTERGPYGESAYDLWLETQYVEPGYVQTGYIENDEYA